MDTGKKKTEKEITIRSFEDYKKIFTNVVTAELDKLKSFVPVKSVKSDEHDEGVKTAVFVNYFDKEGTKKHLKEAKKNDSLIIECWHKLEQLPNQEGCKIFGESSIFWQIVINYTSSAENRLQGIEIAIYLLLKHFFWLVGKCLSILEIPNSVLKYIEENPDKEVSYEYGELNISNLKSRAKDYLSDNLILILTETINYFHEKKKFDIVDDYFHKFFLSNYNALFKKDDSEYSAVIPYRNSCNVLKKEFLKEIKEKYGIKKERIISIIGNTHLIDALEEGLLNEVMYELEIETEVLNLLDKLERRKKNWGKNKKCKKNSSTLEKDEEKNKKKDMYLFESIPLVSSSFLKNEKQAKINIKYLYRGIAVIRKSFFYNKFITYYNSKNEKKMEISNILAFRIIIDPYFLETFNYPIPELFHDLYKELSDLKRKDFNIDPFEQTFTQIRKQIDLYSYVLVLMLSFKGTNLKMDDFEFQEIHKKEEEKGKFCNIWERYGDELLSIINLKNTKKETFKDSLLNTKVSDIKKIHQYYKELDNENDQGKDANLIKLEMKDLIRNIGYGVRNPANNRIEDEYNSYNKIIENYNWFKKYSSIFS
ncbi:MAG: hypothetical protein K8R54_15760 [Bacteroidales bacterium]|nr:hypothetical protein [Bacteroidales bacterium]